MGPLEYAAFGALMQDMGLGYAVDWNKMGRSIAEEFNMHLAGSGLLGSSMGTSMQQQMYNQMNNYASSQIAQTPHNQAMMAALQAHADRFITRMKRRVTTFFRINKECEHDELELYYEPLDELRIKVARWLKGATA